MLSSVPVSVKSRPYFQKTYSVPMDPLQKGTPNPKLIHLQNRGILARNYNYWDRDPKWMEGSGCRKMNRPKLKGLY